VSFGEEKNPLPLTEIEKALHQPAHSLVMIPTPLIICNTSIGLLLSSNHGRYGGWDMYHHGNAENACS
jgi:hypothetical protein